MSIFDRTVNPDLLIRRIVIGTYHVITENGDSDSRFRLAENEQLDLFTDYEKRKKEEKRRKKEEAKERRMQETIIGIKQRFGKNALLKGINYEEGATAKDRNRQIGGHKA